MHPIIVGIDPGTTSAFAVLSFDFKVLRVKSKRNYSLSKIISDIYDNGNPIIVGTDKKQIPKFIKDFSQKTGAKIHKTKYDTKKGEKKSIVKEYGFSDFTKNAHETDALASAIYAYKDYEPLLNKINKYVKKNNKKDIKDKITVEVITKEISIKKAVLEIEKKPKKFKVKKPKIITEKRVLSKEEKEIILLKKLIKKLKTKVKNLQKENKKLKQKKIDIDKETKKIISFKEKRALLLNKENKNLIKIVKEKDKIIKELNKFIEKTKDSVLIKKLPNKIVKGDIFLIEDISTLNKAKIQQLKDNVRIIIYTKGSKLLSDFILIPKKNLRLVEIEFYALVKKTDLDREIKKSIPKKSPDYIKNLLEEYKRERIIE
jgi:predicted RNase H-like nuclease (RuvC/YqgF family)